MQLVVKPLAREEERERERERKREREKVNTSEE
jgi:hypothetical protein